MGYVQPAPHLGRPGADRPRLPLLRRHAARDAARRPATPRSVEARLREQAGDAPLFDQLLSSASHVLFEVSHHVGFAIAPSDEHAIFQRIEFVPLSAVARAGRDGGARRPRVAEGHRRRRDDRAERAHPGGQLPQRRVRRPAARPRCATPSSPASRRSARSTISCWPWRCALARTTLEGIDHADDRCSSTAPRRWPTAPTSCSRCRWRRCARCCGWSKRSSGSCSCSTPTSTAPALAVVIGAEHPDPRPARLQPRRRRLRRRRPARRGRHHRPDAHALLARHQRRRRRGRGRRALPARRQLALGPPESARHAMSDIPAVRRLSPAPPGAARRRRPMPRAARRAARASATTCCDRLLRKTRRVRQLPQAHRARAARVRRMGGRRAARRRAGRGRRLRARARPSPAPPEAAGLPRGRRAHPPPARSTCCSKRGVHADRDRRRRLRSPPCTRPWPTTRAPAPRDGEVIGELRRGYRLGERLLRPAMVQVAKAS